MVFFVGTIGLVLLAHAIAFFLHEYAHSFTAWALGWKPNPLALHYGRLTVANVLFQSEIDEDVNYTPIFAGHHDASAALIVLAGLFLGNACLYGLCVLLAGIARCRTRFLFWLGLMGAANVWSYAPIRTLTTHGDMAYLAQGLHLSVWVLLPIVTLPSLLISYSFFFGFLPPLWTSLFGNRATQAVFSAGMIGFLYFGFFGGAGLFGNYGPIPALVSAASWLLLLPCSIVYCLLSLPGALSTRATFHTSA
ncbi:hypothetical protein HLH28_11085 [Gluconacetobacter tumulisoli]|uniref:Peptidase M50 n=1 Tax=Gluconacetobacter tumulisoli TaxID=1286189 RepID=A0A7W4PPR3_9PROT|nr:hypothetical protein [Gluconacetobacter tumulisoli]